MQLTGPEILHRMNTPNPENPNNTPDIVIRPFHNQCLGSNSYDVHLGDMLKVYKQTIPNGMRPAIEYVPGKEYKMRDWFTDDHTYEYYHREPAYFDACNPRYMINPCQEGFHDTVDIKIPETGLILSPRFGYLGNTVEYTETRNLFPYIDGKSSVGRNFILVHYTAGRGDDGFCGTWTLEISVHHPTVVYPGMRIAQIYYEEFTGPRKPYDKNARSHYNGQIDPTAAAIIPIEKVR